MAFLNGAGSIRAYPHAENTGLVISDVAKIGTIFQKCKFLRDFLLNEPFEPRTDPVCRNPVRHTVPAQCNLSIPLRSPLFSLKSLLSSKKLFIFAV